MTKAFISHAVSDEKLARRLADALNLQGVEATWADAVVVPGEAWAARLQDEIGCSDFVFLIVSRQSEGNEWVTSEIAMALAEAAKRGTRVVPVLAEEGVEPPYLLRTIRAIQFNEWASSRLHQQLRLLLWGGDQRCLPRRSVQVELDALRFSRFSLDCEKEILEVQRGLWSSTVSLAVGVLGAMLSGVAMILGLSDLRVLVPESTDASFIAGVLFGMAGSCLSFWLLRRPATNIKHRAETS
jgi:hypothetical protein